jgi:hypothetical protein
MTPAQLKAARERCEKATAGPWTDYLPFEAGSMPGSQYCQGCYIIEWDDKEADLPFIAHARTDLPAALGEIERLRGLLRAAICPSAKDGCDGKGIPRQVGEDDWEQEQCQWCYERRAALEPGA